MTYYPFTHSDEVGKNRSILMGFLRVPIDPRYESRTFCYIYFGTFDPFSYLNPCTLLFYTVHDSEGPLASAYKL